MIDSKELHPTTREALHAAGWSPERRVATHRWHTLLTGDGYIWSDIIQKFLTNLGGLSILPARSQEAVFGSSTLETDPSLVIGEYERIREREKIIGEALCPIGEWGGESILLLAPSGRVYSETTYHVLLLGQTPTEALDVIVRAHRYPELVQGSVWWNK